MSRCQWSLKDDLYRCYHDQEWGSPIFDDTKQFEYLTLETFQAGLSWWTILKKRENFRQAFDHFEVQKVAAYDESKIQNLLQNTGIVRNRLKIKAAVSNARAFINVQKEWGQFSNYIWAFVKRKPIINQWQTEQDVPSRTKLSDLISKDLKARGFKFAGSTIVYAHMQATGMVNDHIVTYCCHPFNQKK